MSNSIKPISVVRSVDPKVAINIERKYIVDSSAQTNSYQQFTSQSTNSQGQTININVPSVKVITNRYLLLQHFVQYDFTGNNQGGANLLDMGANSGVKAFPIMSCITAVNLKIGNATISCNPSEFLQPLSRFWNKKLRRKCMSTTPTGQDVYQNYADWQTYGSEKNALAHYGEGEDNRGDFGGLTVISNTPTSAQVRLVDVTPIFVPPLLLDLDSGPGVVGCNNIQLGITYGDLSKGWAQSSLAPALSTVAVSFYQAPQINVQFLTPDEIAEQQIYDPNRLYFWPYMDLNALSYSGAGQSISAGSQGTFTLNTVSLNSIPNKLLFCVRREYKDRTFNTTDTYLRIDKVQLNYNNQSTILSNATPTDLYNISASNGLDMDYTQWAMFSGGPMIVKFGKDIQLNPNQAPGMLEQSTLSMVVYATNLSNQSISAQLIVFPMQEGVFQGIQGNFSINLGVLTKEDVLNSKVSPQLEYTSREADLVGGNFFDSVGDFFKKAFNTAKDVIPLVGPAVGAIKAIKSLTGTALSGGRRKVKKVGRRLRGGAMEILGRRDLRKKLDEIDENYESDEEKEEL